MQIIQIEAGPLATNCYLVSDETSGRACIVDAPLDSWNLLQPYLNQNNCTLEAILLTHTHWDHTADCKKIQNETNASIYVHKKDYYRLSDPMKHTLIPLPFEIEKIDEVQEVEDGSKVEIGNLKFDVLFTPGHTEGGVCYVEHNEGVIFAGDTLFKESIGRCDLPGGSMPILLESIQSKLLTLPDWYKVFSGHGPSTTIEWEKQNNPFLN